MIGTMTGHVILPCEAYGLILCWSNFLTKVIENLYLHSKELGVRAICAQI